VGIVPTGDDSIAGSTDHLLLSESFAFTDKLPEESWPFRMQPLRVFLVENHEDTVRYIKLYLEHLGHEVFIAREMGTALRELPQSRCDVLISDIGLPDGDGWLLLEKLGPQRPPFAIAISGYGTGNDQRKSVAVGYNSHLVKPFQPDTLLSLLKQAAEAKGSAPVG
jgi:two-component system CheB/CheR fusion protein